jgi:hypothetical protein
MKHVIGLDSAWLNDCPLANKKRDECDGCSELWQSEHGSLCFDPDSPLVKYLGTSTENPDFRSHYASQLAVLAMKTVKKRGHHEDRPPILGSDYTYNQLHGSSLPDS